MVKYSHKQLDAIKVNLLSNRQCSTVSSGEHPPGEGQENQELRPRGTDLRGQLLEQKEKESTFNVGLGLLLLEGIFFFSK